MPKAREEIARGGVNPPRIKGGRCHEDILLRATLCVTLIIAFAASAQAQTVLTMHRLSAALASEAVADAVANCAAKGYKVTASIVDTDGVVEAMLRGDGASMTTPDAARDKAYTALMLGGPRNEDSSAAVAKRMGANASAGGLAKLPHILLRRAGW